MIFQSNKLNTLLNIKTQIMAVTPPITAEKKLLNVCKHMLETKCPRMLDGAMINEYLNEVPIRFTDKFGTTFLIFLMFRSVINVIDKKNETIMLLIPISGVKIIRLANKTNEPTM